MVSGIRRFQSDKKRKVVCLVVVEDLNCEKTTSQGHFVLAHFSRELEPQKMHKYF